MPAHPMAYQGMSTTLAPAALAASPDAVSSTVTPNSSSSTAGDDSVPSAGLDFNFSQESKGFHLGHMPDRTSMTRDTSQQGLGSGQATPGEGFWDHFVQEASWNDESVSSS